MPTHEKLTGVAALSKLTPPRVGDRRAYVDPYGLTHDDVPALVELAKQWVVHAQDEAAAPSPATWAPLHALRALAELGAEIVVPTFLEMLDALDEAEDTWYQEELPAMCEAIGAPAVDPLVAFLHDPAHEQYPRAAAAHGLSMIGAADPGARDRVVQTLADALAPMSDAQPSLNAHVVGYLAELGAVEQAELIERAFAQGVVETMVCGDWPQIRWEMGLGPRPPSSGSPMLERFMAEKLGSRLAEGPAVRRAGSKSDKAARKRQKQARKKNRR